MNKGLILLNEEGLEVNNLCSGCNIKCEREINFEGIELIYNNEDFIKARRESFEFCKMFGFDLILLLMLEAEDAQSYISNFYYLYDSSGLKCYSYNINNNCFEFALKYERCDELIIKDLENLLSFLNDGDGLKYNMNNVLSRKIEDYLME